MRFRVAAAAAGAVVLSLAVPALPSSAAALPAGPSAAAARSVATAPTASKADEARLLAALRATRSAAPYRYTTTRYAKWYSARQLARTARWGTGQLKCLVPLWAKESGWSYRSVSPGGTYLGIPQTTAGQIRSYGYRVSTYRANPEVQVLVGLRYIRGTYGSPCKAWAFWQHHGWY
jgi:hypothetical protein